MNKTGVLLPPPFESLCKALDVSNVNVSLLAGDGSDRCYYRIGIPNEKQSYVLMQLSGADAEALRDNAYDWLKIADLYEEAGIFYPKPISKLKEHGAIIIQDYGDVMVETKVLDWIKSNKHTDIDRLYEDIIKIITKFFLIKKDPTKVWCQRSFDKERYIWEMNFFKNKFIENTLKSSPFKGTWVNDFIYETEKLAEFVASFSRHFVHRDFHSRNLMIKDGNIAVLDFQDARIGAASYDILSLCFDSYVPFSSEMRLNLLKMSKEMVRKAVGKEIDDEIEKQWRAVLLQRQLKAIGSFAFLTNDKKRGNYLKYVKPALAALEKVEIFDNRWPFISGILIDTMRKVTVLDERFEFHVNSEKQI